MPANNRVKGRAFRGILEWLKKRGLFDTIVERVAPSTAPLMRTPPLAGSWVESVHFDEIYEQLELLLGTNGMRQMSFETAEAATDTAAMTMARTILRLIGATPNAMFSRIREIFASTIQDVEYHWERTDEKRGVITFTYPKGKDVHLRTFWGFVGGCQMLLKLGNATGTIGEPVRRSHNSASLTIDWS